LKRQQWEAARADLNACVRQHPDFVWTYLYRSFAHEKLHAVAAAEADFQRALKLDPNNDARYALFLIRGILHFDRAELNQAADDFRSAIQLKPEQYNAYLNLAHMYLALGEFEQAEGQLAKTQQFRPPVSAVATYHVERGRHLLRHSRYEEAIDACTAALKLHPDQPAPYQLQGCALLALNRFEQAEQSLDAYLRTGGEPLTDTFRARGLARMKLGKYMEAVEDYTRVVEHEPDAEIYQHRGWAHFFCDAFKLSLRDFAKAIELDTKLRDAYIGRGLSHVMLGSFREAVGDAESALCLKPDTPEMTHNIACVFAQAIARVESEQQVADRESLVREYRERAVDAVAATLTMLLPKDRPSFWQDKILGDAALAPIRDSDDFKQLYERYVQVSEN